MPQSRVKSLPYWWVWSFLGWALVTVALSLQFSGALASDWLQSLWRVGRAWIVWPFLSPLFYLLAYKAPLEQGVWRRNLPVHLGAGVLAWFLSVFIQEQLHVNFHAPEERDGRAASASLLEAPGEVPSTRGERKVVEHPAERGGKLHDEGRRRFFFSWQNAVFLLAVIFGSNALYFRRMSAERARMALELEASLNKARLRALVMQLRPHFLFNALNSIAALMHESVDRADEMLVALADFLRLVLNAPEQNEILLEQELQFARSYLEIEKIRFAGRLEVVERVGAETKRCRVPLLLLQPILENAFQHAFAAQPEGCVISIEARREAGQLVLRVADNGSGCVDAFREGTGLANTRARLLALYGQRASMSVVNEDGCVVEFLIPFS